MRIAARVAGLAALALVWTGLPANAEKLTVTQYGRIVATLPWAVALERGMFKEAGLDIDGITAGAGGGTSVRNMLASSLPVGELSTTAVVAAIRTGMPLKIIWTASDHVGELAWAVKPGSGIASIKDLVGKKAGYTNPKSTTEMILRIALAKENLTGKVDILAMGGLGPALTALAQGAIAAGTLNDPLMTLDPKKFDIIFYAYQYVPKFSWSVGVTTQEFAAKNPKIVQAIVDVHRRAVEFTYANRDEAAKVYAKVWEVSKDEADKMLPKYYDWKHWSAGEFSPDGLEAILEGMRIVGDLDGPFDWSKSIDQSFLPENNRIKF
jgi:NitT/TauT family transport system substrate-binding protein